MKLIHNIPQLRERRRNLRMKSTNAEELLWQELRSGKLKFRFRRQYSIGGYILDFYCPRQRLVVEVDGSIHERQKDYDEIRDKYLLQLDYKVLHFTNQEIETNLKQVLAVIKHNFSPSPKSRRGVRGED